MGCEQEELGLEGTEEEAAQIAKMQAAHRGKQDRKKVKKHKEDKKQEERKHKNPKLGEKKAKREKKGVVGGARAAHGSHNPAGWR